ncbi:hypothetical protein M378DRAFT_25814 [Amanita muscaria Koide BX008]|uniref:Uncharacterized protein n=1 Tax=Amanita muscaria (strain Koide BX008) TaxID=946122 RepID=A0A0C2SG58_AMAMK|nr:hypothetical protein M378DRAFT_25814 [Amanita muscaria Koide BX008]
MPSLVASRSWHTPPPRTPSPQPVTHGDHVHYRESHGGLNTGIVVGTEHHFGGPLYVAPLASHTVAHTDRLVQIHNPSHVAPTGHRDASLASDVSREHVFNPPSISYGGGSVHRRSLNSHFLSRAVKW